MLTEMAKYIVGLAGDRTTKVGEVTMSRDTFTPVVLPIPQPICVARLDSLVTLLGKGRATGTDDYIVNVVGHDEVAVLAMHPDDVGRRREFVNVSLPDRSRFTFGQFIDPETFIIGVQSQFVQDKETERLMKLVSSLTIENVSISEDDGISQVATVRQGIALKESKKVEPRIDLRPFRTFNEVEQPKSTFLFRMRSRTLDTPTCALFEADGAKWKDVAASSIAEYLKFELKKDTVVIE